MQLVEIMLLLLVAVAALALLAHRWEIPYPIILVIGGLVLALIPGLPRVRLNPELVFLFFLPPLLYPAALFTSWRDFRANLRPISLLAVGLVLFTTATIGWLAHYLTGMPLAAGFVLGAIVSPPDAVATTAVTERLRVPRRIITILEGESLVNDATALTAYRFAVAAVLTGTFSLPAALGKFAVVAAGGILIGLVVGWIAVNVQSRLDDPPVQITLSLLTPFAAYLAADHLGVSGVLAVVVAGIYIGWRSPETITARLRLQAFPVWEMVVFLLNGLVFILIGLQLPEVMSNLSGRPTPQLFAEAAFICLAVIVVRLVWVFPGVYLPRLLFPTICVRDPAPNWRAAVIVGWSGMRGVDSLAAALALPLTLADGSRFPGRDLILFFTFSVILATLVVQGLSLPLLIRKLKIKDDGGHEREERLARLKANQAALARLQELRDTAHPEAHERLRREYEDRIRQLEATPGEDAELSTLHTGGYDQLQRETLIVERQIILQLRNEQVINDAVLRRIQHDLDLAEGQLMRER